MLCQTFWEAIAQSRANIYETLSHKIMKGKNKLSNLAYYERNHGIRNNIKWRPCWRTV